MFNLLGNIIKKSHCMVALLAWEAKVILLIELRKFYGNSPHGFIASEY
jgi:hypothetical protein